MKKIISILIIFIVFLVFNIKMSAYTIIYTPNGTPVYAINNTEFDQSTIESHIQTIQNGGYDVIQVAPPSNLYNCFSYALYSQDYESNNCWINDPDGYFEDQSYEESWGDVGDIVCYCFVPQNYGRLIYQHAGIVVSNPNNVVIHSATYSELESVIVISKWDDYGLYIHPLTEYLNFSSSQINEYKEFKLNIQDEYTLDSSTEESIADTTSLTAIGTGINGANVPYLMYKLEVEDDGYYSFYASGSSSLDVRLYDSSMHIITDTPLLGGGSDNLLHEYLSSGIYYYRVQYVNETYGTINITMRYNEYCEDTLMTDPASNWLCGTQITINEANDLYQSYGDTFIDEGFTRIIYLDPLYADNLSRLDYYWISSDDSVASVTDFGTILAKDVFYSESVTIYAVYIYDPSVVYQLDFLICPYYGSTINIQINLNLEVGDNEYLDIGDYLPFNYLQYYDWESTNTNVVTINSLGKYNCLTTGTATITGDYCYNERIHIIINVTVTN